MKTCHGTVLLHGNEKAHEIQIMILHSTRAKNLHRLKKEGGQIPRK